MSNFHKFLKLDFINSFLVCKIENRNTLLYKHTIPARLVVVKKILDFLEKKVKKKKKKKLVCQIKKNESKWFLLAVLYYDNESGCLLPVRK